MMTWPSTKSAIRKCISRRIAKWLNVFGIWVSGMAAQATGGHDWTKGFKIFERFSDSSFIFLLTFRWHWFDVICRWLDLVLSLCLSLGWTTRRADDWSETLQLMTSGFGWIGGTSTWHWNGLDCYCCCNLNYYAMKCIFKSYINFFSFLNKIVIVLFYFIIIIVIMRYYL